MSDESSASADASKQRERALSRWENEGGAGPHGSPANLVSADDPIPMPMPANSPAEVAALHVRVIALENLVISLLAEASDRQLEKAREMARYISPRPGFTNHPLTTRAADHMIDLVERACRFRGETPS